MRARIITLFLILLFISCKTNPPISDIQKDLIFPIKINLVEAMANPKNIKLSAIADSIAYIPLEYINDNPVGVIMDFEYFSNNIFIHVGGSDGGFLRFDGKGKFLNKIGTIGRGPGEYMLGSGFSVIDNPERFYILCNFVPRNLLEFDYNGNFLTKVLTANPSDNNNFEAISPDRFLFLASSDTSGHYLACLKNRSNNTLMLVNHPLLSNPEFKNLKQIQYPGACSGVYYDRWPLFYDEYSMDTIYSVFNDSIYPKYILHKGTEGAPFEKVYSTGKIPPERWNYLSPFGFTETPYDIFISAIFKNKDLYLINYNKASQSLSSIKTPLILPDNHKESLTIFPKFENDIDGGISFGEGKSNRNGDVWTYNFDATYFKNQLTKEHFLNSKALYPEKKEALIQLVDSIKEFDNPIIMVVYLKE